MRLTQKQLEAMVEIAHEHVIANAANSYDLAMLDLADLVRDTAWTPVDNPPRYPGEYEVVVNGTVYLYPFDTSQSVNDQWPQVSMWRSIINPPQ